MVCQLRLAFGCAEIVNRLSKNLIKLSQKPTLLEIFQYSICCSFLLFFHRLGTGSGGVNEISFMCTGIVRCTFFSQSGLLMVLGKIHF